MVVEQKPLPLTNNSGKEIEIYLARTPRSLDSNTRKKKTENPSRVKKTKRMKLKL
jgi:hypothetical protein